MALVAGSVFVGGIPYAVLATWGLIWIDHRDELEIRRRAAFALLLLIPIYGLQEAVFAAFGPV